MFLTMLRFFKKTKPNLLGRWQINESKVLKDRKIDLANCDSCGVCSKRVVRKIKTVYYIDGDDVIRQELNQRIGDERKF